MQANETVTRLKPILRDALQLGNRADALNAQSLLLGSIPEFDSMAVVTVLAMIEEEFGITINDDEVSAEIFQSMGTLADFISGKSTN
jgi:acyl carrier protein